MQILFIRREPATGLLKQGPTVELARNLMRLSRMAL